MIGKSSHSQYLASRDIFVTKRCQYIRIETPPGVSFVIMPKVAKIPQTLGITMFYPATQIGDGVIYLAQWEGFEPFNRPRKPLCHNGLRVAVTILVTKFFRYFSQCSHILEKGGQFLRPGTPIPFRKVGVDAAHGSGIRPSSEPLGLQFTQLERVTQGGESVPQSMQPDLRESRISACPVYMTEDGLRTYLVVWEFLKPWDQHGDGSV